MTRPRSSPLGLSNLHLTDESFCTECVAAYGADAVLAQFFVSPSDHRRRAAAVELLGLDTLLLLARTGRRPRGRGGARRTAAPACRSRRRRSSRRATAPELLDAEPCARTLASPPTSTRSVYVTTKKGTRARARVSCVCCFKCVSRGRGAGAAPRAFAAVRALRRALGIVHAQAETTAGAAVAEPLVLHHVAVDHDSKSVKLSSRTGSMSSSLSASAT